MTGVQTCALPISPQCGKVSSNGQHHEIEVFTPSCKPGMDYTSFNTHMNSSNESNNFFATSAASKTSLSLSSYTPEPVFSSVPNWLQVVHLSKASQQGLGSQGLGNLNPQSSSKFLPSTSMVLRTENSNDTQGDHVYSNSDHSGKKCLLFTDENLEQSTAMDTT